MAYGSIKVDNIVFTNGGVDQTVTVSGIVQSISGDITATGTIQGATIIGTSTVSGATVTGDAGQFITATAATGVFTSTLSGATITGNTASFTTITGGTVTLTSGVFASGTAAAPSVSVGTTDNGLYSPGTDQVAISTNGTGRLFVDADGRVVSEIAGIVDQDRFSTSNRIAYFRTSLNAGNQFGQIAIKGFHGAGINFLRGGTGGETNSAGIFSDASDNLRFTSGGATERLRITSDGKLGLGTSSPVTTLHLQKPTGGLAGVQISTSVHGSTLTDGLFVGIDNSIAYLYNYENLPLIFGTNSTERLRLTSDGKLGLGTSSPSNKFHVKETNTNSVVGVVESSSTASYLSFQDSATTSAGNVRCGALGDDFFIRVLTGDGLLVDSSGRVGIGTTSPQTLFHVKSTATQTNIGLFETGGGTLVVRTQSANSGEVVLNAYQGSSTTTAAPFVIQQAGNERARIDSSGRLLVGTASSPSAGDGQYARLAVQGSIGGDTCYVSFARNAAAASITADQGLGILAFTDNTGNTFGSISCLADAAAGAGDYPGRLVFSTTADSASSPTERMRITSDAYVRLASGTGGIQFNGDTAAANALDDYEEGTWTPVYAIASGSVTYTQQQGRYTKVGRLVTISARIVINTVSSPTGTLELNLPFTPAVVGEQCVAATSAFVSTLGTMIVSTATTNLRLYGIDASNAITNPGDKLANGCSLGFVLSYTT